MKTYFCIYFCSALLSLLMTPVVIRLARKLNALDIESPRKVHSEPIPRIGGLAVFISTTLLIITALFLDNAVGQAFRDIKTQIITLLLVGTFFFLVGFLDDLRQIKARYKLLAQIMGASVMCMAGVRIESLNVANLFTVNFNWLSFPITVFWVISITNAVNLIDGLDGLAAGISAVACIIIAILAFNTGNLLMAIFMLALLGSLSGFLLFNFNPAKIFMGDCGSMFLGFIIASTSVMCAMKSPTLVALAMPAMALGLPIFDTMFSILRRYLYRWPIMSPDRSHLHHKLLDMGLRHHHVVIVMYAITIIIAGLGMFMMISHGSATIAIFFCILLLLMLVFRAAGAVRFAEVITRVKYNKTISRQRQADISIFRDTYLRVHNAGSFRQWWHAISDAAEKQQFSELSLITASRCGRDHKFTWKSTNGENDSTETATVKIAIAEHRFGAPMEIEARIHVNGSLESVGRRAMLFGRLIDEYSIAQSPLNADTETTDEYQNDHQQGQAEARTLVGVH